MTGESRWHLHKRADGLKGWAWSRRRAEVLERDRHRCTSCGQPAQVVDHVVPLAEGGDDSLPNLRSLCRRCHLGKSQAEAARGLKRRNAGIPRPTATVTRPQAEDPIVISATDWARTGLTYEQRYEAEIARRRAS